uniref:Ig-like domain-containing protein n=1 Tax=Stegastes partitus TaxID=144197 RepID=A0A3B4Z244_9TELE
LFQSYFNVVIFILVVRAGSDVVLPCSFSTKNNIEPIRFVWRKNGRQEVFLYDAGNHYNNGRQGQDEQFKGRVSHFPDELINGNASIIIRNTRQSDSGNYTCDFLHIHQRFHIELLVGELLVDRFDSCERCVSKAHYHSS